MLVLFLFLSCFSAQAQIKSCSISGLVSDAITGESLPGAHVFVQATNTGVITNNYGYSSAVSIIIFIMLIAFSTVINRKSGLGGKA